MGVGLISVGVRGLRCGLWYDGVIIIKINEVLLQQAEASDICTGPRPDTLPSHERAFHTNHAFEIEIAA